MKGKAKSATDIASEAAKARMRLRFDELRSRIAASFADVPEDEGLREIDAALDEVRRERRRSADAGRNRG